MTSLKTSIKTITYLSDIGCLEIQGASLGRKLRAADTQGKTLSASGKKEAVTLRVTATFNSLTDKHYAYGQDLNTSDRLRSALWIVEGGLARDAGLFQTLAHFGNRRTGTFHRSHDVGV